MSNKIIHSTLEGNVLQEFTKDYLEKHKELIEFVKKETIKQLTTPVVVSISCDCKKHSIKTSYGFEICTKCGNEWDV